MEMKREREKGEQDMMGRKREGGASKDKGESKRGQEKQERSREGPCMGRVVPFKKQGNHVFHVWPPGRQYDDIISCWTTQEQV